MNIGGAISPVAGFKLSAAPLPPERLALGNQLRSQFHSQEEQLQIHTNDSKVAGRTAARKMDTTSRSPSKQRSLSDGIKPSLSPSPSFREPSTASKDDIAILPSPVTPQRPKFQTRGLSLQMPQEQNVANFINRVPLSPKLDSSSTYGSPTSVLPRRSRGLDFSRACTNLHHSTLVEQLSPDSSPTIGGRGMMIPPRKGLSNPSSVLESPVSMSNSLWSTMANADKTGVSSSVGSVNMLDSDSGSSSSDDGDLMDQGDGEDTIITTPQVYKLGNAITNPFAPSNISSPGTEWMGSYSPAAASLMSFQRARLRNGRSRKSSSSASGYSSMQSSGPVSPPLLKSIESGMSGGFVNKELAKKGIESRRESLSLGTNELHLSDGGDSGEDGDFRVSPNDNVTMPATPGMDEKRGVIRRAVTRRGNLLVRLVVKTRLTAVAKLLQPKTKNFARIRAALLEEGAPIDTEVRREAEVIRQVRESDNDIETSHQPLQPNTDTLLNLLPAVPDLPDSVEEVQEREMMSSETITGACQRRLSSSFTRQAIKNSGGLGFWHSFDDSRTPPPPLFPRGSSSGISEDMNMDTPQSSIMSHASWADPQKTHSISRSRSLTPQPSVMPSAAEISRKVNKRRRDDDFDANSFKRRAVSPGLSLQSSPVLPQSPAQKDNGWWGLPPKQNREIPAAHVTGERANSNGSASSSSGPGPPKRVGFQGMSDTNDGLMNMSIE